MIKKFIKAEFEQYIRAQINCKHSNYIEICVASILQQDNSVYKFIGQDLSVAFHIIFKEFLKEKPKAVWMNKWFLFKFGFHKCNSCKDIKSLDNFAKHMNQWNKIQKVCLVCNAEYREQNSDKIKENSKIWRDNNKEKILSLNAKRKAIKENRIPIWFTLEDQNKIELLYKRAKKLEKETNIKYHVDHIIPLQGKYVSGLHHPSNLQIITASENNKKYNYHESEEYWK